MERYRELFENRISRQENGCWIWKGTINKKRYGQIHLGKDKLVLAHRFSWMINKGEIPVGMCVLHTCDVMVCVNPDHLFIGTLGDNNRDRARKGRSCKGETHYKAILTEKQAMEIKTSKELPSVLANKYGISKPSIYAIRKGRNWKHL